MTKGIQVEKCARGALPKLLGGACAPRFRLRMILAFAALILAAVGYGPLAREIQFRRQVRVFTHAVNEKRLGEALDLAEGIKERHLPAREMLAGHTPTLASHPKTSGTFFKKALNSVWKGVRDRHAALTDPTAGNVLGMEFVKVDAGSFQMGSTDGNSDEMPVHQVQISHPFWMGKYEVTQKEYEALTEENPSHWEGDLHPVERLSWNTAVTFCKELTKAERKAGRLPVGYEYRLPTEAEWEYAARGGSKSQATKYAGSDDLDEVGWYSSNTLRESHPVGEKKANELGIHDLSGNVREWCLDFYGNKYYGESPESEVYGPSAGANRVTRGGDWFCGRDYCRVADRSNCGQSAGWRFLGFRVVLAVPPPKPQ